MMGRGPAPLVTGISPNEGVPGTKLTIRGENLGTKSSDVLYVYVGGIDVGRSVQWFSAKKLVAVTPLGEGELEIFVVTTSGGMGTSTVTYTQTVLKSVGPLEVVSYWPEDERRCCPEIIERAGRPNQHRDMVGAGEEAGAGRDLTESTELERRLTIALTDTTLRKYYRGKGSVKLTDPEFNAVMYLIKFHKNTAYVDLQNVLRSLKQSMESEQAEEPVSIVKDNLFSIFQCLERLEELKAKIEEQKASDFQSSGAGVEVKLETTLSECRSLAYQLFEDVLGRRDFADAARTALGVMHKFRFLFNLPHAIRDNIEKGEYNLVINDYLCARNLFGSSEVELFRRVYNDVEDVVEKFRSVLRDQLLLMPRKFDQMKDTIRYLVQLRVPYEPAVTCLTSQKQWLVDQLHLYYKAYKQGLTPGAAVGQRVPLVRFMENICSLMGEHYLEFWKLGAAYIAGQLATISPEESTRLSESAKSRSTKFVKPVEEDKQDMWLHLNLEVMQVLSSLLSDTVLSASSSLPSGMGQSGTPADPAIAAWLPGCVREFRQCCAGLPWVEFHEEPRRILTKLCMDMRRQCVRGIFQRTQAAVEGLRFKETWLTEMTDEHGATTQSPLFYENLIMEALMACKELIQARRQFETELLDSNDAKDQFIGWCAGAMIAFVKTQKSLADEMEPPAIQNPPDLSPDTSSNCAEADKFSLNYNQHVSKARRLILLVNNCQTALALSQAKLLTTYRQNGYPAPAQLTKQVTGQWQTVTAELLERYVELKAGQVYGPIEVQMTGADFVWKIAPEPQEARGYLKRVLRDLCQVYAEVALIAPGHANQAMHAVVVKVLEEMERCLEALSHPDWSHTGQLQAAIDLRLFESATAHYLTEEERSMINLKAAAKRWNTDEMKLMDRILKEEKVRMRLVIEGLTPAA